VVLQLHVVVPTWQSGEWISLVAPNSHLPDLFNLSNLFDLSDLSDIFGLSDLSDLFDLSNLSDVSDLSNLSNLSKLSNLSNRFNRFIFYDTKIENIFPIILQATFYLTLDLVP
jgi:hypothetical protein